MHVCFFVFVKNKQKHKLAAFAPWSSPRPGQHLPYFYQAIGDSEIEMPMTSLASDAGAWILLLFCSLLLCFYT